MMALEPYDKGLIGTTLRYPYEVRHAGDYFGEIPDLTPAPELLRLATHILDSKTASFAPAGFRDRYEEALLAHLQAKQTGLPPQPQQSFAVPRRAINLIEAQALYASVIVAESIGIAAGSTRIGSPPHHGRGQSTFGEPREGQDRRG
jgi:non-homologous end joining protein Ku